MSLRDRCWRTLLLAFFMSSSVPEGLVVVCVREDGHVALEIAGPPTRPTDAAGASGSHVLEATPCACGDRCGPCRDLRVGAAGSPALVSSPARQTPASAPPWAIRVPGAQPPAAVVMRPRSAHPGRSPSSWPELQDSVVLRI